MSNMLHWFTSPEWAQVVKALLHSLWQGALIAVILAIFLRRVSNPVARYRLAFVALMAIVLATVVTWAITNPPGHRSAPSTESPLLVAQPPASAPTASPGPNSIPETVVIMQHKTADVRWTAWLAFAWLAGAVIMLARAGFKVAAAEKLRRSCRPLNDSRIKALLTETRRALGIANQIRVGVTDKLTSPAVVGVVVPMLILPLALLTSLTPEQIRFVLMHELAHIRRRDYLANLIQFLAESLLFFNPAVWWISHQIRREREACCDALATELSGAPGDYAQTLVHVAEKILHPAPAVAPAFGNKREPSALAERIQRLLVPGYRPSLCLTWRAMLGALVLGSVLLFSSAVGTRVTVAAVLTNQQPANGAVSDTFLLTTRTHEGTNNTDTNTQRQKIIKKLNELTFDKISFPNIELREVADALTEQVKRRDPTHQGVQFILDDNPSPNTSSLKPGDVIIDLESGVTDVTLMDVLEAIVRTAERPITFAVTDDGVHFSFPALPSSELSTRTFNLGLYEVQQLSQRDIPIRPKDFRAGDVLVQWLNENRIYIYPPKNLSFDDRQGILTVHATPSDLDGINQLVDKVNAGSKLVEDGKLLLEQGKLDEAEAKFEEAINTPANPQTVDYYLNLVAKAKSENRNQTNTNPPPASAPSDALSPGKTPDAEQIQTARLLQDGKLLFQMGKLDDAETKLTEAFKLDPDNQAARYYLSLIKQVRDKREMDSRNLRNNNPAHNLPNPNPYARSNIIHTSPQRQGIYRKLNDITFDKIAFPDLPLSEVVRILTEQTESRDPDREGLNFVISEVKPAVPTPAIPGQPAFDATTGQRIAPSASTDGIDLKDVRISLDPGLKNVRLMDVLEAIVKTADHPIKYSMLDYGIEFSLKGGETPELFTRTFKVDPNTFFMGLQNVGLLNFGAGRGGAAGNNSTAIPHVNVSDTSAAAGQGGAGANRGLRYVSSTGPTIDVQSAIVHFFDAIGVQLTPPKSVFFNDRQGTLTVHATAPDLDLIEAGVDTLNIVPPEVTIKARFVQLRPDSTWPKDLDWFAGAIATNDGHSFTFSLSASQFQTVLKDLENRKGADLLNEGEVTTLSGRQAQFQVVDVDTVADNTNDTSSISNSTGGASTKFDPQTNPFGTTLDTIAYVGADGSSIQMTLIPTVSKPVREDQPGNPDTTITNMGGNVPITGIVPQPHAQVWQVTTNCLVRDGQTVVIGGLSQTGNTSSSVNTNLLIFITPTLVDSFGHRIHSDDYYDIPQHGGSFGPGGFGSGGFGGGQN